MISIIPDKEFHHPEFLSSFSKPQVAELSCACISHPPWVTGGEKEKKPFPSFPPLYWVPACLKPSNSHRTLSCFLVRPQQNCCFTSTGDGTKPKSPNPELNPPGLWCLLVWGFIPCATKAEDTLLQAKAKKIGMLFLKSANFSSLTREMKEITPFLERESKKELQCPRQQC